ncbi:MAG: tRNA epoxyqueuosine(34) reductase QueG [Candidatus Acidiferrales bacterium]
MTAEERTRWVINQAQALGFDLCGVAPVEDSEELQFLPEWLARGYGGEMHYLGDARRRSPERVLVGARSLIVCALNYNTPLPYSTEVPSHSVAEDLSGTRGWISRYAWGDDYHDVVRSQLEALLEALRNQLGQPFEARAYVDTGPVAERVAAKYAGLGWLAKNTCLIHPQLGSWLFLGVILTTLDLAPSLAAAEAPVPDLCGNCRLCIEACPTGAIVEPYVLDARRCISYLTIELRGTIPEELRPAMGRMVFGCDICQDVCPWNRQAPETSLAAFLPRPLASTNETRNSKSEIGPSAVAATAEPVSLFTPALEWLASLGKEEYREVFRGSTVKRAKWRGLVRNTCVALGNSGAHPGTTAHSRIVALLERLAGSDDAIIAEHARWALGRLRSP